MNELLWIQVIIGPLILLLGFLFWRFPPRKINALYGYRTANSMRSQAAWNFANRYSAKGLIFIAFSVMIVQCISYFLLDPVSSLSIAAAFLLIGLVTIVILTERMLKSRRL